MPPKATFEEVKGFALTTSKLVFGGESAEAWAQVKSNIRDVKQALVSQPERELSQWISQTTTPMGDKENSPFFDEYVTKIYERREECGLDELVGDMRGVVVQVEQRRRDQLPGRAGGDGPLPLRHARA